MRRGRMRVPEDRPYGIYHCLSRVVDRQFLFLEVEKEHFVALLRECQAFCEVRVLTYCVMSNHFHILVQVPRPPDVLPSAEEVLAKLRRLSGHANPGLMEQRLRMFREAKDAAGEAAYLATFHARMWDLSAFMKLLKQRFTQWYNGRQGRKGTLWEERFRSVMVEGEGLALGAMAAYIDLNPVRAGMVKDPQAYRWSGYGEALAGGRLAQEGLRRVAQALQRGRETSPPEGLEAYRVHLYVTGSEAQVSLDADGRAVRGVLPREEVLRVLEEKGRLVLPDYLRCRVRYFCDGAVLGSREFVEEVFGRYRARFGEKRRTGARRMRGLAGEALFTLRNLRLRVFG